MIRSTFSGFTTAQLAMAASQRALDVTGQNIANINTVGYTRQRLDLASLNTQGAQFYNSNNSVRVGYGVHMTGVSQLRDPFLDMQYRSQVAKLGTSDSHVAGLEQLETIFDESTTDGIRSAFENITSSLDTLSQHVGSNEYDSMVRSNMQILLNLFHENSSRLQDVRDDMTNSFATTDVGNVNQILENIANLNRSIKNSQVLGNPALELQDQRNELIDQLAGYLPISAKYTDKEISPGQYVEILDITFTDTNGESHSLVSDGDFGTFQADVSGQPATLKLNSSDGKEYVELTDILGSGSLKGTLDLLNKSGEFDQSDFRGLGYYEKAFDSLVNQFAETFNKLNQSIKTDADGNVLYEADGVTPQTEARPLFIPIDDTRPMSAENIKIADEWTNGTYGITNSVIPTADGKIGSTANDNILSMVKAMSDSFAFKGGANGTTVFYNGSFSGCFANIENTLGIDKQSAETMFANQMSVLSQTANSRDGVSGVQLDEEGMNLMHYNQSYTAAARLMTTLDEALDTLINRTGVVGR